MINGALFKSFKSPAWHEWLAYGYWTLMNEASYNLSSQKKHSCNWTLHIETVTLTVMIFLFFLSLQQKYKTRVVVVGGDSWEARNQQLRAGGLLFSDGDRRRHLSRPGPLQRLPQRDQRQDLQQEGLACLEISLGRKIVGEVFRAVWALLSSEHIALFGRSTCWLKYSWEWL